MSEQDERKETGLLARGRGAKRGAEDEAPSAEVDDRTDEEVWADHERQRGSVVVQDEINRQAAFAVERVDAAFSALAMLNNRRAADADPTHISKWMFALADEPASGGVSTGVSHQSWLVMGETAGEREKFFADYIKKAYIERLRHRPAAAEVAEEEASS